MERVVIKTTRIRSLGGEQFVLANTERHKRTVSNDGRLLERRILFGFGVSCDTPPDILERIPEIPRRVVHAGSGVRFDRAHFKGVGDGSLDHEVVCIVLDPDYNLYRDEQQRINLGLMREPAAIGVDCAFPTRTLHLATVPRQLAVIAPARPAATGAQAARPN